MAVKKSELYSSLWKMCDELRGGMDASQYKDYVLVLLFVKYVSDRYAGKADSLIEVPEGGSFDDFVALVGDKEIGEKINIIIGKLAEANGLRGVIDVADFNDEDKLGKGKDMVDRLSNLVKIFNNPSLNFRDNRADGDDLLGDAYEYLMRHFATESGKSKGQFYTPAEVSRIMSRVIGISKATSGSQTIYDPTCGSGSLLLKAHDEAKNLTGHDLTIYGQEMDNATSALAKMNMILHDCPTAEVWNDNTLSSPHFKTDGGGLKTFDFAVANPPFSYKSWSNGLIPSEDEFGRFEYGEPPAKNGDYAFLLHVLKSLKSAGKGCIVMPHGVLFRGNVESTIRTNVLKRGYIKGIIGLPANLFYGTGIPACLIILEKEHANARKGIFMIDASKGFVKDGNKNRLREQDIHRIVDVFNTQDESDPKYARMVPLSEIEKHEFNLNIPRYIDSTEPEDIQDIEAHLLGGIPDRDIDDLDEYWSVYPNLRKALFKKTDRKGFSELRVPQDEIKQTIFEHREFVAYSEDMDQVFAKWKKKHRPKLKGIEIGGTPREVIGPLAESILVTYADKPLIDQYDIYQHLLSYWLETMKDDVYMIVEDGWKAEVSEVIRKKGDKKVEGTIKYEGKEFICELIPKELLIPRFFAGEWNEIEQQEAERDAKSGEREEFEDERSGEDDILDGLKDGDRKITKGDVEERIAEYEQSAFTELFPDKAKTWSELMKAEDAAAARVAEMLETSEAKKFLSPLKNARGNLTKGNVKKRVAALKKAVEKDDSQSDLQKEQAERIRADLEKTSDWNYELGGSHFDELDVIHRYLTALADESSAKKQAKKAFEGLAEALANSKSADSDHELIRDLNSLDAYSALMNEENTIDNKIKALHAELEVKLLEQYGKLTADDVKSLVVDDKWMATVRSDIDSELHDISQSLAGRLRDLAERYSVRSGALEKRVAALSSSVDAHLAAMGFSCN